MFALLSTTKVDNVLSPFCETSTKLVSRVFDPFTNGSVEAASGGFDRVVDNLGELFNHRS